MAAKRIVANVTYDNLDPLPESVSQLVMQALTNTQYNIISATTTLTGQSANENTPGTAQIIMDLVVSPDPGDGTTQTNLTNALTALTLPTSNNPLVVSNLTVFDSSADPTPGPPQPSPNFPII